MKTVWSGRTNRNTVSGESATIQPDEAGSKPHGRRSACAPSLKLHARRAGSMKKCLRFQPDWGNLAVRDDSGGCRKQAAAAD